MALADWFDAVRRCAVETILTRASRHGSRRVATLRVREVRAIVPELLENRVLLSSTSFVPTAAPPITVVPVLTATNAPSAITPNTSSPFRPSDITTAYGVSSISFNGTAGTGAGQTIAIIDAYNDPNIIADASFFNSHFGLPAFNTTGNATFQVVNENGQGSPLPSNASSSTGGWDSEEALDVEWAHTIAPKANIILFEANSASDSDLFTAVQTAAATSGVSVVSMSFGSSEFSGEHSFDSTFTTPSGHAGVTFLASTGDSNAPAEYPAYSPNVVAVGGTSLVINANGSYGSESAWGNVNTGSGGGGGVSSYESQPSFQTGNVNGLSSTKRTAPDISMLADPNTGVYLYSTWNEGGNNGGYYIAGGTSLACPMWAGLVAITDQGRALNGLSTLDGPSQTLPRIYQLPSSVFHDVTSGSNGFAAGSGYDLATGIGTPIANLLVPQLAGVSSPASKVSFSVSPSSANAGASIGSSITVQVQDAFGDLISTDTSNVTLTITTPGGATLSGTATVAAVSGVATFSGLSINKAGTYTLTASDGSLTSGASTSFTISAAAASQVVFTRQPTGTTIETAISPSVTVSIEDTYGNVISNNASTVILTLSSGTFSTGSTTVSVAAVAGVASFSNIVINNASSYTLAASDGAFAGATSSSFTIAAATPTVSVTDSGGTYNGSAFAVTGATAVDPISSSVIASLANPALTFSYYAGTLTTAGQIAGATALGAAPTTAGAYTVVATYGGSANYNSASSAPVNFTIAQRALHVSATAQNKTYDGTNTANVTLSDDRVGGDSFTVTISGATFASKNIGNAIVVSVSGISISGGAAANYTLASSSASTSANITALAISGTLTANSKTYDATTAATLATRSLTGVIAGDSVSLTGGTATFNSKDVASATTVTVTGLTLTGAHAGNYTLSNPTESAAATISTLAINGSVTASSKVYDGTTAATLATRTLSGVLGTDAVSLTGGIATFNSKDVLSATTVSVSGLTLTGAQAGDYSLNNPSESASATITPLSTTATISVADKIYDGTTSATLTSSILSGIISGDTVGLSVGTTTFNNKDVANGKIVSLNGAALSSAQAADYSLADPVPTTTADITALSITGTITAANKTYDATTHAVISSQTLTGVLGADQVTLTGGTATFDTKDVGSGKTVTDSGLTLSGAQATDYSLSNPTETATANITALSITGSVTAAGKTYDTTTAATITSRNLTGVLGAEAVTLTGGTATFDSQYVNATTVTVTGLTLSGAAAGNYSLSNPTETAAAHITPAPLTVTLAAANKSYDDTTAASLTSENLNGVLGSDDVSLTGGSAAFSTKDAGNGKTVTLTGITLAGAQAGDYALTNSTPTTTANITPLAISGSIVAANKTYDATTHATITTQSLTGVLGSDHVTLTGGTAAFDTQDVGNGKTVTDTGLTLTGAQAADYSLSNPTETTTANVTPLSISASVAIAPKTYDGTTHATIATQSLSGVLGTDRVTLTAGTATFNTKDANTATTVSVTGLSLAGAQAGDYLLSNPTPTIAAGITPLQLGITITAAGKAYDGATAATLTGETVTGILGGDDVTVSAGAATFSSKDAGNNKVVTLNGLSLSGAQAADYALPASPTTIATIAPLAITGSIAAANKIYDATTRATIAGTALPGVIGADHVKLTGGTATFDTGDVGNGKTVTDSGLTLTGAQAADYTLANPTETATANITPLSISANVTVANKTYDGTTAAAITGESLIGGLAAADVHLAGGSASFSSKDVPGAHSVTVTGLSLTGAQAGNYSLANPAPVISATITPRSITGSITANNKVYDGTTGATLANEILTGVLNGDSVTLTGGNAAFDTRNVGTGKTVTATGLTLAGALAADYSLSNPTETTTANITPLTISGNIAASSKIYDGTTAATLTGESLTGVLANDAVALSGGIATFNSKDVTAATTVTATGLFLTGASAQNYLLANPTESAAASIMPLGVTGSFTANNKLFDGTTAATIATTNLSGVLAGDTASLSGGTATFSSSAVGTGKTVTATGFALAGAQAGDYALINPTETATANIVSLTISGSVVNDVNANSVMQTGEPGLANRTVTLQVAGQGAKGQRTARTDASGNFSFTGLSVGNYLLKITTPTGWRSTTPAAAGQSIALQGGASVTSLHFGETNTATVSGSVFLDVNGDRKRQGTEGGLAGWTVLLTTTGSNPHSYTAITDATGAYMFAAVSPGSYHLSVTQQSGYATTTKSPHYYAVTLTAAKVVSGQLFGEQLIAAKKHVSAKLLKRATKAA